MPNQPIAPATISEPASHRRADGTVVVAKVVPMGRISHGLIISDRRVVTICRNVITVSSAAKYKKNRRASGFAKTNTNSNTQAIARPAAIPGTQNHGATDSLTNKQYRL